MTEFKEGIELFAWGFMIGYFWHPVWTALKKIWREAKNAKEEW